MSDINELRNEMDAVTLEMINLLKTRTDIAKQIGEVKKSIGKGVADEEREENLRRKIMKVTQQIGLDETLASKFLNFLLNESIKVQSENKQTHLSIFLKAKSLEQEGKKIIMWTWNSQDYNQNVSPESIVKKAALIRGGDILLFHSNSKSAGHLKKCLPEVIRIIKEKNLKFKTLA